MGHRVQAFVGREDALNALRSKYEKSKVIPLCHGYFLLPLTDELYDAINAAGDTSTYRDDFMFLSTEVVNRLLEFSDDDGLVYFETDYFGGKGEQGVIAAKAGKIVYGPSKGRHSINKALHQIGVKRALQDEYDVIGLGTYRSNEDWILQPTYKKPVGKIIQGRTAMKWLLLVIIAFIIFYFVLYKGSDAVKNYAELDSKAETFSGASTKLQKTVILPTFDTPVVSGKNNIWCSSFQLAWNEMKENVINEPVVVTGAEELSQRLNTAEQTKEDLAQGSYYANAGKVSEGIIDVIQREMAARFPAHPTPVFDAGDELIAYAYLESYIKFTAPFRNYERRLIFTDSNGNTTQIKSFGVWDGFLRKYKPLCKQIDVLYYSADDDYRVIEYALDLCKDSEPYQIVIASVNLKDSLEETFDDLQAKITAFKDNPHHEYMSEFGEADILQVPDMFWEISHHFAELESKRLANQNFEEWPISTAVQIISFRLDRSGVILESEAKIGVLAEPREFILNKPFLLYLKKRDTRQPFFVMWVDNAELLTPFEDPNEIQ